MIKNMETMVIIDDKIVSSEIFTECFACDYGTCGGACCIIGDSGAPMEESEPERIEANYSKFSPLMSPEGRAVVAEKGFFEIDSDGDMVTPLVPGREECAYASCDEEGNWFCTIERSWCRGGSDFVKPISCRLYPIRVSRLSNGMTALNLHRWNICSCAFAKGKKEGIPVFRFLQKPLTDAFGEDFYAALEAAYAGTFEKAHRG